MADNNRPLFQGIDEEERIYAPQQLPANDPERARVNADEKGDDTPAYELNERPSAAPVANVGTSPSAPPNIGHAEHGGTSGDPNTQAKV